MRHNKIFSKGEKLLLSVFTLMMVYFVGIGVCQDRGLKASQELIEREEIRMQQEEERGKNTLPEYLMPQEYVWQGYHEPLPEEPEDLMGPIQLSVQGIEPMYTTFNTSAYCSCSKCCGAGSTGVTASGAEINPGTTVAAGPSYPFGSVIHIPELDNTPIGGWFIVEDRGEAITDGCLDIAMASHSEGEQFGRHWLEAEVYFK